MTPGPPLYRLKVNGQATTYESADCAALTNEAMAYVERGQAKGKVVVQVR